MGEVLAELEHALRSNGKVSRDPFQCSQAVLGMWLTAGEDNLGGGAGAPKMQGESSQHVPHERRHLIGASVGRHFAVKELTCKLSYFFCTFTATRNRFNTIARTSFSIGAALVLGGWTFDRSLHSSVRRILAAHGTRMQRELSTIIMAKNLQNPASPVSKIFYPEHVYDDSSYEKPLIRWRARNFYEDSVVADSLNDPASSKNTPSSSEPKDRTRQQSEETTAGLGDLITDPLDCILGYPEAGRETLHSSTAAVVSRRDLRAHKRRQRRRHAQHDKDFPNQASREILSV